MRIDELFGLSSKERADKRAAKAVAKVRAKEKKEADDLRKAKMQDPDTKTMSPIEAGNKNHPDQKVK